MLGIVLLAMTAQQLFEYRSYDFFFLWSVLMEEQILEKKTSAFLLLVVGDEVK